MCLRKWKESQKYVCSADCLVIYLLTLFAQADLSVSKDRGGGYIFWVGFGGGFQSFFENNLSGSYLSYSKGFMKFG